MTDSLIPQELPAPATDREEYDSLAEDGYCLDCGEEFHLDDTGGYNPPCVCGEHCRSCHEAQERESDEWRDAYPDDDEPETPHD